MSRLPDDSFATNSQDPRVDIAQQAQHALGAAMASQDSLPATNQQGPLPPEFSRPVEEAPPPPYTRERYGHVDLSRDGGDSGARVTRDGRIDIKIKEKSRRLADMLSPIVRQQYNMAQREEDTEPEIPEGLGYRADGLPPPPMNIVIQIVGSRGDVQPFVALGQVLKRKFNHRVRIATHATFKQFVTENGLEHFTIGGDPAELMAFMVKNPGLMPGIESIKAGDISKRRKTIYEMVNGCWRSAIEPGDGSSTSGEFSPLGSLDAVATQAREDENPFIADAIIANPVSFAHVHIAEKLGIPLHLMFTMPWSPTQAFPHPLANIISSGTDQGFANYISYILVDLLTWQGLGDIINKFRHKVLQLEPCSILWAPGMLHRLKIPYTYCWSPALIPKPKDWGRRIDISGFYFLNLATDYRPPSDLAAFLDAGPPPIYIGFGSIVVDDPNAMTKMIFEAVEKTGQRALVSKGWGGLGADELGIPEGVFMLGNVPHDWLFRRVSCVVHHGGAGTTAAGIAAGRPTVVIPFFGDQPFWGAMTARAGAGPMPIAYKHLNTDKLAAAILEALKPRSLERAAELSAKMKDEAGAEAGADMFHKHLNAVKIRCSICPERVAVWRVRRTDIRLSAFAAAVLGNEGLLDFAELKLHRPCEYEVEGGPPEPITGGAAALVGTLSEVGAGVVDVPAEILRAVGRQKKKSATVSAVLSPLDPTYTDASSAAQSSTATLATPGVGFDSQGGALTDGIVPTVVVDSVQSSSVTSSRERPPLSPSMASVMSPDGSVGCRSSTHSRSGSVSPGHRRSNSPCEGAAREITYDSIIGAGKAGGKIVSAGLRSPMDFTMSIAQGFHNAPKLYGDTTVRKQEKVTDLQSGLKSAGREFGYGFYDGITGLFTQPIRGARADGASGFVKGMLKGAFGLVLKPGAAIWGLPGYTFKGIYMEITKYSGNSTHGYIIAARTAQGFEEWKRSTTADRDAVVELWKRAKLDTKRGRQKYGREHTERSRAHMATNSKIMDRNKRHSIFGHSPPGSSNPLHESSRHGTDTLRPTGSSRATDNSQPAPLFTATDEEFEDAIRQSVAHTSQGNSHEDAMIERALRASVATLRQRSEPGRDTDDHAVYGRAARASNAEAVQTHRGQARQTVTGSAIANTSHDNTSNESLASIHPQDPSRSTMTVSDREESLTDNDEEYKAAIAASIRSSASPYTSDPTSHASSLAAVAAPLEKTPRSDPRAHPAHGRDMYDDEIRRAMTLSQNDKIHRHAELERQKTEDDLVMEYVLKQSLLESQPR